MDDGDEAPRAERARPEADDGPEDKPGLEDEFRTLAEDWIAIWQSEITAYLTDPETQQAWSAMMAVWAGAAQAMMRGMPPAPGLGPGFGTGFGTAFGYGFGAPGGPRPKRRSASASPGAHERRPAPEPSGNAGSGTDAAPRPAPAAAAPVARDDEIHRLEQRVAELERGLAERDRRRGTAGEDRRTRRGGRPRS